MSSGIKSWLNISPGVASSLQCVTQAYKIHSRGVRILALERKGEPEKALKAYAAALQLTPRMADARARQEAQRGKTE
jgi:hypothetical protein